MHKFIKFIAIGLSSLAAACSPAIKDAPAQTSSDASFEWTSPLEWEFFENNSSELKKYIRVAEDKIDKNESLDPEFKLGNLVFFTVTKTSQAADATYQRSASVVALPNTYIRLPDEKLFKVFSSAVRVKPDAVMDYVRVKAMIMLSSGNPSFLNQEADEQPQWIEKDGVLTMTYFRLKQHGMEAETREKCTLSVDTNQNFKLDCQDEIKQ